MRSLTFVALPLLIISILIIGLALRGRAESRDSAQSKRSNHQASKNSYLDLRKQALQGSREKFGLPATRPDEPWGVVMDWGLDGGSTTVVALSDGSASVYLSSGGGYIGGEGHDAVRKAALKTVQLAHGLQPLMSVTKAYPLPRSHQVIFYLLADSGIFAASASEEELQASTHPLFNLGNAVQNIITQYRIIEDQRQPSTTNP